MSHSLSRIWLLIPENFLQHFDRAIVGMFPSRSEAIRRGMNLVLREVESYRADEVDQAPRREAFEKSGELRVTEEAEGYEWGFFSEDTGKP